MFKFTLVIWIELASFLFCIASLRGQRDWWRIFTWYMLFTVLLELAGFLLYFHLFKGSSNEWLYNLRFPVEMAFFAWFFLKTMAAYRIRPQWFITGWALVVAAWMYESYTDRFMGYSDSANLLASVLIIISCCVFYYQLLRAKEYVDLPSWPPFWIVSGLFIFYFGSTGLNVFSDRLSAIYRTTGIPIRFIIMVVLNFILYTCWSYAFICIKRNRISSSQSS
ncbi:MAG: hypothetical protein EOO09_05815 [Chitinophagaceae bacterium]|nr:MAG: hypothetical protein EOO09_05815 [Chitinophagaceae bacterium]